VSFYQKLPFLGSANRRLRQKLTERLKRKTTVYIIPNRNGLYYAFIVFTLFLMALSYGNNVLLFFDFFLFGIFIYAQFLTHYNLYCLKILKFKTSNSFAGEVITADITGQNKSFMSLKHVILSMTFDKQLTTSKVKHISAKSLATSEISFTPLERGLYSLDSLKCHSTYPLGTFYVWKYVSGPSELVVYPECIGKPLDEYYNLKQNNDEHDEYKEHKPFDNRTSINRVDWKHFAKTDQLSIKKFSGYTEKEIQINLEQYLWLGVEVALSQVCKWIVDADNKGLNWTLSSRDREFSSLDNEFTLALTYLAGYG
jgi:uncharacterized protein (DUF58 family)